MLRPLSASRLACGLGIFCRDFAAPGIRLILEMSCAPCRHTWLLHLLVLLTLPSVICRTSKLSVIARATKLLVCSNMLTN